MSVTTRWMAPVTAGVFAFGVAAALAQGTAPVPAAPQAATAAPVPAAPPGPAAQPAAAAMPAPAAPPATAATPAPPAAVATPAPGAAPPAAAATPAPAGKVTGLAAWTLLVGNSVSGKVDGEEYTDFYMENGTVKTLHGSTLSSGKWTFEDGRACFMYPKEDPDCYRVEVDGDVVNFTDKSGSGTRLMLEKGNPKKL